MKSLWIVLKEQFKNFYLIRRLSMYDIKSRNKNNYLGIVWEVLTPVISILIYWFVFSTLRQREPIEMGGMEVPFFYWMAIGFIVWTFFFRSSIEGSKSIYTRLKMLSKMNFPLSAIPNIAIFSKFNTHILLLTLAFIVLQIAGYYINIYYIQLIYFIFGTYALIFSFALITSTLSTLVRDVHLLLNSLLRMLLYLSGVLWPLTLLSDFPLLMQLMQLNPLVYLIEGYRAVFFGTEWYIVTHWEYTLYFWGLIFVMILIGSKLHVTFRRNFIDYL
ncbi:ABC transporter permease [Salinicoccus albus]|uniref:ABC transporter permease n=1 Tax=Salinicoccus albus TaxID=418756 RepID=UPI000361F785|nr:ABC transporter permease [Salinicoccus albus]